MASKMTISETLRKAIAQSDKSFLALEQESGVLRQSLMKFARGERQLRGDMFDRLAEYFGLELVATKPMKRKGEKTSNG